MKSKMFWMVAIAVGSFSLAPVSVAAKTKRKNRVETVEAKAVDTKGPKTMTLVFGPDSVEAKRHGPGGTMVVIAKRSQHSLLFRVRPNFVPELIKSAEDI